MKMSAGATLSKQKQPKKKKKNHTEGKQLLM